MNFIRSFIFTLVIYAAFFLVSIVVILFAFMPLKFRYFCISRWNFFTMWWLRLIVGLDFTVTGKENIPTKACVIASNHQSAWETIAFLTVFPQQALVLKKELLYIPFFGWGLALLDPVVVNRGNKLQSIKKVIKKGVSSIKRGLFVTIFPEGTRHPYNKLGAYKVGAIAIATTANADILPVYHDAGKYWAKNKLVKRQGCVKMVIGKPISTKNRNKADVIKELEDWAKAQQANYLKLENINSV